MNLSNISEYNRDQWATMRAIDRACHALPDAELAKLKQSLHPYLAFRRDLEAFQEKYVTHFFQQTCFNSGLSLCCGFESIFVFFADQVISFLFSTHDEISAILQMLQQPNHSGRCVFLGRNGCLWRISPVSCGMFFCDQVQHRILESEPYLANRFKTLQDREKEFTFPEKPVLFDDIEAYFLARGADSPHMYLQRSPGLLRLKVRSGLVRGKPPSPQIQP